MQFACPGVKRHDIAKYYADIEHILVALSKYHVIFVSNKEVNAGHNTHNFHNRRFQIIYFFIMMVINKTPSLAITTISKRKQIQSTSI